MKKSLILLSIIASLASANAYAKTEGQYIGFDLLRSKLANKDRYLAKYDTDSEEFNYKSLNDSSIGVGLNYNYAFNFNNFFVAPGAFFDFLNNKTKVIDVDDGVYKQEINVGFRYGIKTNIGYDITDQFSAYIPLGISVNHYNLKTNDYKGSSYQKLNQNGFEPALVYGLGFAYHPTKELAINLEYNHSGFEIKSKDNIALLEDDLRSVTLKSNVNLNVIKLGVSYNF